MKNKLHKKFIICVFYLIVSIFLSLLYLLGSINNQLETTENTMSPAASVILFSSFLILPPLIWLIILILKKQVVFNIEVETKNANKKYEYSALKIINSKIDIYLSNSNFKKILNNYCSSNIIPLWQLEFACIPLNRHIKYKYSLKNNSTKKIYLYKLDKWISNLEDKSNYIK